MVVRVDGEVVNPAAIAAATSRPAASVGWLATQLTANEEGLRPGSIAEPESAAMS